jgi:5-hydroxyisourate hydrolase
MAFGMKRISTHVLDTTQGKPAQDVMVRLQRKEADGDWVELNSSRTDADGRCAQLLPENEFLCAGLYRLLFDTGTYHGAQNIEAFYPVVEISFQVRTGESQFHIPLLLSPNGYTTYRGS